MKPVVLPAPAKRKAVAAALNYHFQASEVELQQRSVYWTFTQRYFQGVRNFQVGVAASSGLPTKTFTDRAGRRRCRYELALVQSQTEMGRLLGIDTNPAVVRRPGLGLNRIREDAVAQATLNHLATRLMNADLNISVRQHLVDYGTVGIAISKPSYNSKRWEPSVEIVPAWELRPIPSDPSGIDQIGGITRSRSVPLSWLKAQLKNIKAIKETDEMGVIEAPYGSNVPAVGTPEGASGNIVGMTGLPSYEREGAGDESSDAYFDRFVQLREHWLLTDGGMATRYILQAGDSIPLVDIDYTTDEWMERLGGDLPMCPVGIGRYAVVGSFWGRGFAERQIPINREIEALFGDYLDNLRRTDRMRFLAIPMGTGFNKRQFDAGVKNGVLPYQPDYGALQHKPEFLSPPNVGDSFGRALGMMGTMSSQLSAQGEMVYGGVPSRVDSAQALSVIGQYQNIPLAVVGESIEGMFVNFWRACLGYVRYQRAILDRPIDIQLTSLDDMVVGLKIDPSDGTISLSKYAIPAPLDVKLTIRSKAPRNPALVKAQLDEMRADGKHDVEYEIAAIKEGIDIPLIDKTAYNNYETAWLENILLYGDGESNAQTSYNEFAENHTIHYLVVTSIIQSLLFKAAGEVVQKDLLEHQRYHGSFLNRSPTGAPTIDQMGQMEPPNMGAFQAAGMNPPGGFEEALSAMRP